MWFTLFILFLTTSSLTESTQGEDHEIHLSKCEIIESDIPEYLEISMSIFYDDLLEAVGLKIGQEIPDTYTSADELIEKFINKHFFLEINGKRMDLEYIESNSYPPAVWTTFQVKQSLPISQIRITNTILIDQFDDQKNIISFPWKGKTETVALDKDEIQLSKSIK